MKKILAFTLFASFASALFAQIPPTLLKVHVSPEFSDFLTTEVPFVNFVSDRRLSDLQFQRLVEPVGNGAVRYRYLFFGYGKFEGQNDTITWHTDPGENPGSIREKGLQAFKRGLLPYLIQTPLAQSIDYKVGPEYDHANTPDPWNKWTYKPSLSLNGRGAYNLNSNPIFDTVRTQNGTVSLRPGFSFWHISDLWKVSGGIDYYYIQDWNHHTPVDSVDYSRSQSQLTLRVSGVYSLSPRWSLGAGFARSRQWKNPEPTYFGNKNSDRIKLGVEYSFLPYRDYFRRRFVIGYLWGLTLDDFNTAKTPDIFYRNHQLYGEYAKIAPWGYFVAEAGTTLDFYPKQSKRYSLRSRTEVAFNVGKNIYINLAINGSWSDSKYNLTSFGGLPTTKRTKLYSGQLDYSLGFEYYFGSGYRNVVNPRLYASDLLF